MSIMILFWSLLIAQLFIAMAIGLAVFQMIRGPRAQDRILGTDTLYVNSMLMLVILAIRTGSTLYFEAALVIVLMGFITTLALAKFLMRGEVIE